MENKKIKEEKAVAKVFSIIIKTEKGEILWQEVAFSLEDAFLQAKNQLRYKFPEVDLDTSKIDMFMADTLEEMIIKSESVNFVETEKIKIEKPEDKVDRFKSALMKEIVDKQDKGLYEKHMADFTEFEKKFLTEKLNQKK